MHHAENLFIYLLQPAIAEERMKLAPVFLTQPLEWSTMYDHVLVMDVRTHQRNNPCIPRIQNSQNRFGMIITHCFRAVNAVESICK